MIDRSRKPRRHTPLHALVSLLLAAMVGGCGGGRPEDAATTEEPVRAGWTHYRLGNFDSAVRAFSRVLEEVPPDDPRHLVALYGLATTWSLRAPVGDQDTTKARAYFEQLIADAPESELAAWSLLGLARMQHLVPVGQEPDYPAVRQAYQRVVDRFPAHLAGQEAFLYLQSIDVATLDPGPTRRAAEALESFVSTHNDSGFVSAAYSLLATAYHTLADPDRRLHAQMRALETKEIDPSNPLQENSWDYWQIAAIAEFETGDFDVARRFYQRLIDEYPQDVRRYTAGQALVRMDRIEQALREGRPL